MNIVKLNIGCGDVCFDGWINIDINSDKADLKHDMRNPLPYADGTVNYIYNEHFIEHLPVQEGISVMREFHRVLKSGGVLRIATIDLTYLLFRYFFFWKRQYWIRTHGYELLQTNAEMINLCFREWGHQYLYSKKELRRRLQEAGFNDIRFVKNGRSDFGDLAGRETRKDSRLIAEAIKN